jgi:Tfp pilus assembly protein PilV
MKPVEMIALRRAQLSRVRDERGFGMVELLAAMTVMLVGVMSLFALFQAGIVQVRRASTITTAAALADAEMEKFRAVKYETIGLDDSQVAATDTTYKSDAAYRTDAPSTTITGGITETDQAVVVTSATGFPAAPFRIKVDDEIMLVTGGVESLTWNVTRGMDGTLAASHAASATATLKLRTHLPTCGTVPCTNTVPSRAATGADGKAYRVDTYVTWTSVTNSAGAGSRMLKLVTIVVRENEAPYRRWARISSAFDESTGL